LIEARFKNQPRLQAEMHGVVGQIFADMGASSLAAQYGRRQVEGLVALEAPAGERARALLLLAQARMSEGKLREAQAHAIDAMRLSQADSELGARAKVINAQVLLARNMVKEATQALDEFDRGYQQGAANNGRGHGRARGLRLRHEASGSKLSSHGWLPCRTWGESQRTGRSGRRRCRGIRDRTGQSICCVASPLVAEVPGRPGPGAWRARRRLP
jgi:hypothetical protein